MNNLIFNYTMNLISLYRFTINFLNKYKFSNIVFDEKTKMIKNQNILQRYLLYPTNFYYINSIRSNNQIYYSVDKKLSEPNQNDIIEDLDDYNNIIDQIEYIKINFNGLLCSIILNKPDFISQIKYQNNNFFNLLKKTTANTKFKHMIYYYLYNNLKISDVIDKIEIHYNNKLIIDEDYNIKQILDLINKN